VLVANEKGLEFGGNTFGVADVNGSDNVYINLTACYLTISGDYNIMQGIGVSPNEKLKIQCDGVKNNSQKNINFTAQAETRGRTIFGKKIGDQELSKETIAPGEEKNFSFLIPKNNLKPQAYQTTISFFDNKNKISNDINIRYVIQGESATIQNASLDKDYYKKGDNANVKIFLSGLADVFPGARLNDSTTKLAKQPKLNVSVEILSGNTKCYQYC